MKIYLHSVVLFLLLLFGCKEPTTVVTDRHPGGQKMTEYTYPDKNDTLTYTIKVYHENGKLKQETEVEDNKFIGQKKTYYENGNIQRIEEFFKPTSQDESKYDCRITNYRPNGAKESEYEYENLELNGLMINYDTAGNKIRTAEYVNGKKNGWETVYFSNGKAKRIVFVKEEIVNGFDIDFKETGDTLMWSHNGEFGANGIFYKKWLDDGNTLVGSYADMESSYVIWRWYDKTGKQIKQKTDRSGGYAAPE